MLGTQSSYDSWAILGAPKNCRRHRAQVELINTAVMIGLTIDRGEIYQLCRTC